MPHGASPLGRHQTGLGHMLICWLMLCQILYCSPFHDILVSDLVSAGVYTVSDTREGRGEACLQGRKEEQCKTSMT